MISSARRSFVFVVCLISVNLVPTSRRPGLFDKSHNAKSKATTATEKSITRLYIFIRSRISSTSIILPLPFEQALLEAVESGLERLGNFGLDYIKQAPASITAHGDNHGGQFFPDAEII